MLAALIIASLFGADAGGSADGGEASEDSAAAEPPAASPEPETPPADGGLPPTVAAPGEVADAGSVAPPPLPGLGLPAFEVGATVMGTAGPTQVLAGPAFRCTLRVDNFLVSGSFDWPLGAGASRVLLLLGAGYAREVHPKVTLYGLALGGLAAIHGPPVLLSPSLAVRTGAEWLVRFKIFKGAGLSLWAAYDLVYLWSSTAGPVRGFTFGASTTASFEVGRP